MRELLRFLGPYSFVGPLASGAITGVLLWTLFAWLLLACHFARGAEPLPAAMPPVVAPAAPAAPAKAPKTTITIYFFTQNPCAPCQRMEAHTWSNEKLKNEIVNQAADLKTIDLTAGANHAMCRQWHVNSTPTTIIVKDGKETKRVIGFVTADDLIVYLGGTAPWRPTFEDDED